jgi:hypothetical protein
MLNILEREQLENQPMTLKDSMRIDNSNKMYAVFVGDKLHLVKDDDNLKRLIYERLRDENRYNTFIYQLK